MEQPEVGTGVSPTRDEAEALIYRECRLLDGLGAVSAVVEAAAERELVDVRERLAEPLRRIPELKLPQAGCIDHEAAVRKEHELPVRGRVPSLAVVLANRPRREELLAGEGVDER